MKEYKTCKHVPQVKFVKDEVGRIEEAIRTNYTCITVLLM